jgi:hypothetical protein
MPAYRLAALLAAALAAPAAAQGAPVLHQTLRSPFEIDFGAFGAEIIAPGDLDGDGAHDLVVGAPYTNDGRAYVLSGTTGLSLRPLGPLGGCGEFGCSFGKTLATIPDVTGDGVPEIAVGSPNESIAGWEAPGAVYLFDGATGALRWWAGNTRIEYDIELFGKALGAHGDANGDGLADVVATESGRHRLVVLSGTTGAVLREEEGATAFAFAPLGDVDGDGVWDVAVAAPEFEPEDSEQVYVVSSRTGAYLDTLRSPLNPSEGFGSSAAPAGDVDGDGVPDLLVAAWGRIPNTGRVHVLSGATGAALHTLESPAGGGTLPFGYAVAGGMDVDGDGVPDVAVGAPFEDRDADNDGSVYVFSGASGTLLWSLGHPGPAQNNAHVGEAVAFTRTADGRPALAVGVPGLGELIGSPSGAGRVYVYAFGLPSAGEVEPDVERASLVVSPNPFADGTTLSVSLAAPAVVRLDVLDVLGRTVATLLDGPLSAGTHAARLDGASLAPGVYAVRLTADGRSVTRTLVRTR